MENMKYPEWMNDDQKYCFDMLCLLKGGAHHVSYRNIHKSGPDGIKYNDTHDWATFDFSYLTHAVVLAHDMCIRFAISPCNPQFVGLYFHKRERDAECSTKRHPNLEEAVLKIREYYNKEQE